MEVDVPRARRTRDGILTRRTARRILRPYLKLLATVVFDAWETWNQLGAAAPSVRVQLGRGARAMTVSDFIKDQIVHKFTSVGGCEVVFEYGRPVLAFAGGDLKLRLGKIDLGVVPYPRNERQLRIWSQEDAVAHTLPAMPSGTWARCGYVLDATETAVAGIHVLCDMNGAHEWNIDLPVPLRAGTTVTPLTTPVVQPAKIASATQPAGAGRGRASSE
ncbi:hypothetical protein PV458_09475 [Streptomyces sp. MN03-5084-2B]|nr:hypothetical protein [Streptomyces sp. MN03-5084-2B]